MKPGTPFSGPAARRIVLAALAVGTFVQAAFAPTALALPAPATETVVVERVTVPVLIRSKRGEGSGVCEALEPAAIEVLEDGEPVEAVTRLESKRLPTIHAILVDTSGSMKAAMSQAKDAARRYILHNASRGKLPEDERFLIASFDESMTLGVPLTSDVAKLEQAIASIEAFPANTTLWDSLYYLIQYLGGRSERKVVILVTDGWDTASVHTFEEINGLAGATEGLTVFPVGLGEALDMPPTFDHQPRSDLESLASTTGGEFMRAHSGGDLDRLFRSVRERLDGERFLTYIPAPTAPDEEPASSNPAAATTADAAAATAGAGDGSQPWNWRKVEVRLRRDEKSLRKDCALEYHGPSHRLVTASRGRALSGDLVEGIDLSAGEEDFVCSSLVPVSLARIGLPRPPRCGVAAKLRLPVPPAWRFLPIDPGSGETWSDQSFVYVIEPRSVLIGHAIDVAFEGIHMLEQKFGIRNFAVQTPPLDDLLRQIHSPEDVFFLLLEQNARPAVPTEEKPNVRSLLLVNGKTFLEMRRHLGQILFDYDSEYRSWAIARLKAELAQETTELLREQRRSAIDTTGEPPTAAEIDALRRALDARVENPRPQEVQRFLSEWLGDIPAARLFHQVERKLVNVLLREPPESFPRAAIVVSRARASWDELVSWFPEGERARALTPLVPAYDPGRDAIGFYRVVLPPPDYAESSSSDFLEPPVGLDVMDWLLRNRQLFDLLRGRLEAVSIETDRGDMATVARLSRRVAREAARGGEPSPRVTTVGVRIVLAAIGSPGETLEIAARMPVGIGGGEARRPECVGVTAGGSGDRALSGLAAAVTAALEDQAEPCAGTASDALADH